MKVCYVWSEELIQQTDRLPAVPNRASLVHNLIEAYDLTKNLTVVKSKPATYEDLREFHSELYLDYLKGFEDISEDYNVTSADEEFGLGYDCAPVSNMYKLISTIAGGSVTAAKCLTLGLADVAINWCGGWHHAQRFGAEGFCYVNDIVIAIGKLKKKYQRILYIDLDVHHGNGVQDAFNISKSVLTLSFHKFEPGFYPGTGGIDDIGNLVGTGYAVNFPLHSAYSDQTLEYAFGPVFEAICSSFDPEAMVVQCGADALAHDPNGAANLTIRGYSECMRTILDRRKPTLLLGGGGYNHANTARLWTSLTALVVNTELAEEIPEHDTWTAYGPDYELSVRPTFVKDGNLRVYLDDCIKKITEVLSCYVSNEVAKLNEPEHKRLKLNSKTNDNIIESKENSKTNLNNVNSANELPNKCKLDLSKNEVDVYDFV